MSPVDVVVPVLICMDKLDESRSPTHPASDLQQRFAALPCLALPHLFRSNDDERLRLEHRGPFEPDSAEIGSIALSPSLTHSLSPTHHHPQWTAVNAAVFGNRGFGTPDPPPCGRSHKECPTSDGGKTWMFDRRPNGGAPDLFLSPTARFPDRPSRSGNSASAIVGGERM
jgi:hypothetical protein